MITIIIHVLQLLVAVLLIGAILLQVRTQDLGGVFGAYCKRPPDRLELENTRPAYCPPSPVIVIPRSAYLSAAKAV